MLKAIKDFVVQQIMAPVERGNSTTEHALRLATAALLVEMSRQDDTILPAERAAVEAALREKFDLTDDEVAALYTLAEGEAREATDYYQFTSLIKDHFNPAQKEKVVELLWLVAAADGHIDQYEEHMVRRIAELLYLPHSAFIRAKFRALGIE
jgi:uncharacterized tellurite resistance protein B-like protein